MNRPTDTESHPTNIPKVNNTNNQNSGAPPAPHVATGPGGTFQSFIERLYVDDARAPEPEKVEEEKKEESLDESLDSSEETTNLYPCPSPAESEDESIGSSSDDNSHCVTCHGDATYGARVCLNCEATDSGECFGEELHKSNCLLCNKEIIYGSRVCVDCAPYSSHSSDDADSLPFPFEPDMDAKQEFKEEGLIVHVKPDVEESDVKEDKPQVKQEDALFDENLATQFDDIILFGRCTCGLCGGDCTLPIPGKPKRCVACLDKVTGGRRWGQGRRTLPKREENPVTAPAPAPRTNGIIRRLNKVIVPIKERRGRSNRVQPKTIFSPPHTTTRTGRKVTTPAKFADYKLTTNVPKIVFKY